MRRVIHSAIVSLALLSFDVVAGAAGAATVVKSLFPTNGQSDACVDTPLRITFDDDVTLGPAGKILLVQASDGKLIDAIDIAAVGRASGRAGGGGATTQPATGRTSSGPARPVGQKSVGGFRFN